MSQDSRFIHRKSREALVEKYRMIGESEAFLDTMQQVSRAARVNRPVLIIGERGTGKELVAARLHYLSERWQQPRITINCAAFNPELLESELFGHEQGAFTGAVRAKPGRFELANNGSLFLDELANSPMVLQEKILRVLEYQEFERVGGVKPIEVDVRVIAATNQDLPKLCARGKFKEDLLDRLSFEVITLPPLRERREDIPLLVTHFAGRMVHELGLEAMPKFSLAAIQALLDYAWPGNVRELKNVVERAVYRGMGDPIDEIVFDPFESPYRPQVPNVVKAAVAPSDMEPEGGNHNPNSGRKENGSGAYFGESGAKFPVPKIDLDHGRGLSEILETIERRLVLEALELHKYNQSKASEHLGIGYYQLRRIIKRLDIPT